MSHITWKILSSLILPLKINQEKNLIAYFSFKCVSKVVLVSLGNCLKYVVSISQIIDSSCAFPFQNESVAFGLMKY